jgi:ribosomal protein S18 acetylase RimI-like enzyme
LGFTIWLFSVWGGGLLQSALRGLLSRRQWLIYHLLSAPFKSLKEQKMQVIIRKAVLADAVVITAFNQQMALETEHKELIPELVLAGVHSLLTNPAYGFYLVAEHEEQVVGSLMITTEWSDWRNGVFWWVQSVYVQPKSRRQGIYRKLYAAVKALATEQGNVCGFRLYVEKDNQQAQQTYRELGMQITDYLLYEEMQAGIRYLKEQAS